MYYVFKQNQVDGEYIVNEFVAVNTVIEADTFRQAIMKMQIISMDYNLTVLYGPQRFVYSPSMYSENYDTIKDQVFEKETIVHFKNGQKLMNYTTFEGVERG